jgi:hypothetical protein
MEKRKRENGLRLFFMKPSFNQPVIEHEYNKHN